jgi:hypothetical protein
MDGRVGCGPGRYWCSEAGQSQFDDYRPKCYFSGRVCVRSEKGAIELAGWREVYHDWQVIRFSLTQMPGETRAEYTVRTPVGQPDVTVRFTEPNTVQMVRRHSEVPVLLSEILTGIGAEPYDTGPFVRWQSDEMQPAASPDIESQVRGLVGLCESDSWRDREWAIAALEELGIEGAKALLSMDRDELSPAENMAIDLVLSKWPVIKHADLQTGQ